MEMSLSPMTQPGHQDIAHSPATFREYKRLKDESKELAERQKELSEEQADLERKIERMKDSLTMLKDQRAAIPPTPKTPMIR
jgi:predicted  nucleic acid-binding Zn-ribbon protein